MADVSDDSQGERVRALLCRADCEITIVAPFIKVDAFASLLAIIPPCAFIHCITRWLPRDIAAGVSDPEILELLQRRGRFSLSLADNLHAKLYVADDMCLVGSVNVTHRGLGEGCAENNIEILVATTTSDPGVIRALDEIERIRRTATPSDAVSARALAKYLVKRCTRDAHDIWVPRSRRPELAYKSYRQPPAGFLRAADRDLLMDIATTNIQPGLVESEFATRIRLLLNKIPLAQALLSESEDAILTRVDSLAYLSTMADSDFSTSDLWQAFVNWMAYFYSDTVIKQEIAEFALRRAQAMD